MKLLFLFPNTSNDGVVSNAITILSAIAKKHLCEVDYFETSFYKKTATAAQDRTNAGEFKPVSNEGFTVTIKPYEDMFSDFHKKVETFRPDLLIVSANSLEFELFKELMNKIRFSYKPYIMVGGIHATFSPDEVINHEMVDALTIGEGEESFEEFVTQFGKSDDYKTIRNMWFKEDGIIYKNELRELISEDRLWSYERDYSFYEDDIYFMKPFEGKLYKKAIIEFSRGCPYSCSYCVNSALKNMYKGKGKFIRYKKVEALKEEMLELKKQGFNLIHFLDENFLNISIEDLKLFCEWYKEYIKLPIILQARPESFTEDKIAALASMGVEIEMSCGVETGSEKILNEVCNRFTKKEQTRLAFELMEKYGIRSRAYVMIGFPNETRDNVFETINFVRELKPYLSIMSIFYPFVGVPLRNFCIENGYITGNEPARTFTDGSILKNQPMSSEEIVSLRRMYSMYITLPRAYFSEIEKCEKNYDIEVHQALIKKSWEIRDNWPNYTLD